MPLLPSGDHGSGRADVYSCHGAAVNMSSRWPRSSATSKPVRKWRRATMEKKRRNRCARYDLALFLAVFGPEKRTNKSKFSEGFPRRRRRMLSHARALLQKFTSEMRCVRKGRRGAEGRLTESRLRLGARRSRQMRCRRRSLTAVILQPTEFHQRRLRLSCAVGQRPFQVSFL